MCASEPARHTHLEKTRMRSQTRILSTSALSWSVADPGFPVGGCGPRRGAWTPEAVTF